MASPVDLEGITEGYIQEKLADFRPAQAADAPNGLVRASVLIPLFRENGCWNVLLTRRTERVANHRGQVAFPGGAADPGDCDVVATALRETYEEVGMDSDCIKVLGTMPVYPTVSRFLITPVVGRVCWPVELHPASVEVERIFTAPLRWLADPGNWTEQLYTRPNGSQEMVVFFLPYEGETIWGITARILVNFIDLLLH